MNENIDYLPTGEIPVEGKVTVELYNADGSLAQKQEKKNYFKIQNLELLSKVYSRKDMTSVAAQPLMTANNEMLHGVMLMGGLASNFEANPTLDKLVYGTRIGWGNRTASAITDTVKGTFNATESTTSPIFRRMVWDFATSQANGQITDIYVGAVNSDGEAGFVGAHEINPSISNWRFLQVADGLLYFLTTNGELTIRNQLGWGGELTESKHQIPVSNITDFKVYDGRLWIANNSTNIRVVRTTSPTVIERTIPVGSRAVRGIIRRNTGPGWYLTEWSPYALHKVSDDFELLDTATLTGLGPSNGTHSFPSGPDNFISDGWIYFVADNMSIISRRLQVNLSSSTPSRQYIDYSEDVTLSFLSSGVESSIMVCTPAQFFSRAKLDSPINKTQQQTMKIIYEYNFPDFVHTPWGS